MKNIKTKKLPIRSAVVAVSLSLLFASCLKDKGPVQDFSQSPALVSFQYKGGSAEPFFTSLLGQPTDSTSLEVTLSVASLTLSTPVTATIAADPSGLDDYNSENGTDYAQLPDNMYTLQNGGQVTISPGQQIVTFSIHFVGDQIDFSQDNGLSLKITAATGATIATNLNTAVLLLKLKNPYEGDYNCTGYFVHPSAPRALNQTGFIGTITPVTSVAPLGDLGGWTFYFDVDPETNALGNWVPGANVDAYGSDGSGFLYDDNLFGNATYPGPPYVSTTYNNTWDPATKTFWMHYGYNGGGGVFSREIYEEYQQIQ